MYILFHSQVVTLEPISHSVLDNNRTLNINADKNTIVNIIKTPFRGCQKS